MDNNKKYTPDDVRAFTKPSEQFLCPLSANHYNIQFLDFRIRDVETNKVFFQISREQADEEELKALEQQELSPEEEIEMRTVRYHFGNYFFDIKTIGTSLTFSVGSKPVKNFLMIERHYFREKLIQSYEFKFPFCIPNTTNNWESIYDVPALSEKEKEEMILNPWETKSDSFYFVGDELVMHNKAEYNYAPLDSDEEQNYDDNEDDNE
ncbi:hypothetical protein ABPG72_010683 [Tetrahymena utriculariae]